MFGGTDWLDAKLKLRLSSDGRVSLTGTKSFSAESKHHIDGSPVEISIDSVMRRGNEPDDDGEAPKIHASGNGLQLKVEATAKWGKHSADAGWEHEVTAKPLVSKAAEKKPEADAKAK